MDRRQFIKYSSGGILFIMVNPHNWIGKTNLRKERQIRFKPYRPGKTIGNIVQVTPDDGFFANTYYDICPFSPSQRFLALTKFSFQDRITRLGDLADIVVIDLEKQTIRAVYQTKVWGYQLGANLHWGRTDRYLYTNDILDGKFGVCVQIDLTEGSIQAFKGPVYDFDPVNNTAIGPHLEFMNNSQYAYATPSPDPENLVFETLPEGASPDDGLWETNLRTGQTKLLLSLQKTVEQITVNSIDQGASYYFFHTKYSPKAHKVMLAVRYPIYLGMHNEAPKYKRNPTLMVCDRYGKNVVEILSRERWSMGGHHPNWHPNNRQIVMNLTPKWLGEDTMRFCTINCINGMVNILSRKFQGSGHPSIDPTGRYLLSDCYPFEPMAVGNGEIPIRLIDLEAEKEETICTVFTDLEQLYSVARYWGPSKLDAHPVWSRDGKKVCFNGAPERKRQVFIADLEEVI